MTPETQSSEPEPSPPLELLHQQSDFDARLGAALMEFANDVISYRTEDIARYGGPGATFVVIRAPRPADEPDLHVVE